ncbi:MAG: hypothetical protein ACYTGC_06590 [Planctomycetota bacterium]
MKRGLVHIPGLVIAATAMSVGALHAAGQQAHDVSPLRLDPVSMEPAFDPLPEKWGLRELRATTRLGELDASFVLYFAERARFQIDTPAGWVYLIGGRQLLVEGTLTEEDVAELLFVRRSLCSLQYESDVPERDLHVAAGAYRVATAPRISTPSPGVTRVEFEIVDGGPAEEVRLQRLVCWVAGEDTIGPLADTVPGFIRLTRKEQPGFRDPPVDERPIRDYEIVRRHREDDRQLFAMIDERFGLQAGEGGLPDDQAPFQLPPARPGILSWLWSIQTGTELAIDASEYFLDADPALRARDLRDGIYFRNAEYRP